jgi:hypothetical protein
MYGSKSLHLATVKLCTSCSQKANRTALSLKSEMKILSCWGIKKYSLNGLNGLYHPMQLTDCLSDADAHWSDQNFFYKNQF